MKTRNHVYLTISVFFLIVRMTPVSAEVHSGFWLLQEPMADSLNRVDFSELVSSAISPISKNAVDGIKDMDCFFRNGNIITPNGVYYDSALSSRCDSLITGKMMGLTYSDIFYLDSMVKRMQFRVPSGVTYVDSVANPRYCRVFFIKTGENRHAVIFRTGESVGGINRTWYYWAYQPDTGTALFKQQIYELPEPRELKIELNVFSGRENPVFVLDDSATVAAITHAAFVSINTLFDSTKQAVGMLECPSRLGYCGLSVSGGFRIDNRFSDFLPTFEICSGNITLLHAERWQSAIAPQIAKDKDSYLEKLVITYCCEQNLTVSDQYGTLLFCDLIPDSLKPSSAITGHTRCISSAVRSVAPAVSMKGRTLQLSGARNVRSIDIFSLAGERLHSFDLLRGENVSFDMSDVGNRCILISLLGIDGSRIRMRKVTLR